MSATFLVNSSGITTAAGHTVQISLRYTAGQKVGVSVLTAAAGVSLVSVVCLLVILAMSAYKSICMPSEHRFIRTHVVVYFICLLLSDGIAAVGSLMSSHWVSQGGVFLGTFCTSQGAFKNAGNVGTALWTMVIAVHTFCIIILKWRSRDYVLYTTIFVVWAFIGSVVLIGPAAVQNMATTGPYFGISGYWCWITDAYAVQHVTLEYFWMFLAAFVSCVLYTVTFLNLRGNLVISGGKLHLRFRRSISIWDGRTGRDLPDGKAMSLAKQMLVYPVAYTALILPIAICRFLEWSGVDVPFELTLFADTVFVLSGLVNAVLFTTTRKIVPGRPWGPSPSRSPSRGSDMESQQQFITPFVVEKVSVSPIDMEPSQQVVTVPLPLHMKRDSPGTKSVSPTESSVYSQDHPSELVAAPVPILSIPIPRSQSVTVRQSVINPLNIVKNPPRRKAPLDVPVGVADEGLAASSGSPYSNPTMPHALPQLPPAAQISHSKSASYSNPMARQLPPVAQISHSKSASSTISSSSNSSRRAPGTRF